MITSDFNSVTHTVITMGFYRWPHRRASNALKPTASLWDQQANTIPQANLAKSNLLQNAQGAAQCGSPAGITSTAQKPRLHWQTGLEASTVMHMESNRFCGAESWLWISTAPGSPVEAPGSMRGKKQKTFVWTSQPPLKSLPSETTHWRNTEGNRRALRMHRTAHIPIRK